MPMKAFTRKVGSFNIHITQQYDYQKLKQDWKRIEGNIEIPFFLTWDWVSCWIETYSPELIFVTASMDNIPVCIGLFTQSDTMRHRFIRSRQIRLHQTGNCHKDQIWVEYNDFICEESYRVEAVDACLSILNSELIFDEIILSMMPQERGDQIIDKTPNAFIVLQVPSFSVDLENIRAKKTSYLESLSANTRYQIRRSMRLYEKKYGNLQIKFAENKKQALAYFHKAAPYHVQRWYDSGYKNDQFINFHENLIKRTYDQNCILLIEVMAGNETIAVMYYQVSGGTIYFYLHGLKYEEDPKMKPGLVSHYLATEYLKDTNFKYYDFMGGYSQYKAQLARKTNNLVTVVIQKPKIRFKFENMAREIKRQFPSTTR